MEHNRVTINGIPYEVNDRHLLIDLMKTDCKFLLLKLYDDSIKDLKLVKYHVSQIYEKAVFFFLKRNTEKDCTSDEVELQTGGNSGVYFMHCCKLDKIEELVQSNEPLISEGVKILPFISLEDMAINNKNTVMGYNHSLLLIEQQNKKQNICTRNSVIFETFTDLAAPCQHMVPFIFFNEVSDFEIHEKKVEHRGTHQHAHGVGGKHVH